MTPVTDEPILPEENEEPLPPVGHVRVVYLGPVAPHWEVRSDFGDPALIEEFRRRTMARLVLLPPHDPQYRRNRERVIRDAERENILLDWDLGMPEEESVRLPAAGRTRPSRGTRRSLRRPRSDRGPTPDPRAQSPVGSSSSGRLIRSNQSPGASTSDGRGQVALRDPQAGQAVFAGPLHYPAHEGTTPVDLGLLEVQSEQRPGRLLALARSMRRRYHASASWEWDPTSFCPTELATWSA